MSGNIFKAALKEGRPQFGYWLSLASPLATEAIASLGFDWVLIDTEHSPVEVAGLVSLLQAAGNGTAHPIVRPAWNDPVLIKRILDIGATTLLLPFVQSADEARAAVASTRYPPDGIRGVAGATRASQFGTAKDYLQNANANICCIAQIESRAAVACVDEIASVDGIDAVFIGPSDLAASLGHLGNPGSREVQVVIRETIARVSESGVSVGVMAANPELAKTYLGMGASFVSVGVDVTSMIGQAARQLQQTKIQSATSKPDRT